MSEKENEKGYLLKLAERRKTVREFSKNDVSLKDILYAINVARQAPSGANKQPWRFIIIRENNKKELIRKKCEEIERKFHDRAPEWMKKWMSERNITWKKPFLTEAPYLVFVFADITAPMAVQSVWLAIGYLLLALEEKELSTVTYTPSEIKWANELLNVPNNYRLQAILPIGKIRKGYNYKKQPRLPLDKILFYEQYKE